MLAVRGNSFFFFLCKTKALVSFFPFLPPSLPTALSLLLEALNKLRSLVVTPPIRFGGRRHISLCPARKGSAHVSSPD